MENTTETKTYREHHLKEELAELAAGLGLTAAAAKLGVSENLIRGVLRDKLPVAGKLARALGYEYEMEHAIIRRYKKKL